MDFERIDRIYDKRDSYLAKSKELINSDLDRSKEYLELAKGCQREADKLLGITSTGT